MLDLDAGMGCSCANRGGPTTAVRDVFKGYDLEERNDPGTRSEELARRLEARIGRGDGLALQDAHAHSDQRADFFLLFYYHIPNDLPRKDGRDDIEDPRVDCRHGVSRASAHECSPPNHPRQMLIDLLLVKV